MRYLKRFAVLALPVVAAMSLGASANAAPSTQASPGAETQWTVQGPDNTVSGPGTASPDAALALVSYVSNETGIGIGVLNVINGSESYDAILPGHRRTDTYFGWDRAQGFYVGAGSCVDGYFWNGSRWVFHSTARGPVRVRTDQSIPGQSVARWAVRSHRAC
ncbi:hypothetical protein [Streptomyces sp. NPDC059010]|uniref:hypothetical protein n=1 Tax=Streptomyces sp. NPDC059010 TaxID=3346695 RepID=UPI003682D316